MNRAEILRNINRVSLDRFEQIAMAVFQWQAKHNTLYAKYLSLLGVTPSDIISLDDVPFLPIGFFKNYTIKTGKWTAATVFSSSGTTGQQPSLHHVRSLEHYLDIAYRGFASRYGDPKDWVILALLPSYLERQGSSLVAMADYFIKASVHEESGFFLHDFDQLKRVLMRCEQAQKKTMLLGVTYALLDFAAVHPMQLLHTVVMETGGMKGQRAEMSREAVHQDLKSAFGLEHIHSEYGMTELFSQAYSDGNGLFYPTDTMRVFTAEITDPLARERTARTGTLQILDIANMDTCSFIATEDLGRVYSDGSFEVLGRLDAAELRGCNLMVY